MLPILLTATLLLCLLVPQAASQGNQISVGPRLGCTAITFTCPGTSGCCTIGGCCGSGCCANGYSCINEGTPQQACCWSFDPTKCGTVKQPTSSASSTGTNKCLAISNCRDVSSGQTWTCLLGSTCALSYRGCNPCPYIGSGYSSSAGGYSSSTTSSVSYSSTSPSSGSGSSSSSSSSSSLGTHLGDVSPLLALSLVGLLGLVMTWV